MNRPLRALPAARLVILLFVPVGVAGPGPPQAEPAPAARADGGEPTSFYRLVKRFDFNERPLGNYDDTPMYWMRLAGPGLPTYARGQFDDQVGHQAPPSFRLGLIGGNVAYEYRRGDVPVIPGADYRVEGYVRSEGLQHARAFMEAYLIDRYGETIPESRRISALVRSDDDGTDAWRRLRIDLPGDYPTAYALRLRVWILQSYVWRAPGPSEVDPIIRRDIHARAWFDDISVYRLPRARLRMSNPANVVAPGAREYFLLEFVSATAHGLETEFSITDEDGRVRHSERETVPSALYAPGPNAVAQADASRPGGPPETDANGLRAAATVRVPVPALPAGRYRAVLRVMSGEQSLMTRAIHFAVLPELGPSGRPLADLGVDLGPWRGGSVDGAAGLLRALGCGAVKVGVPMVGDVASGENARYFRELGALVRRLGRDGIEPTGVILSESAAVDPASGQSTRRLVARNPRWRKLFSPILAHFSGLFPAWQLGAEQAELRDGGRWDAATIEAVREHLGRFMTLPELVVPYAATEPTPAQGDPQAIWVPAEVPARWLPQQLDSLAEPGQVARWLTLQPDRRPGLSPRARLTDLTRRIVLAKALAPQRVFVQAPFELSGSGGEPGWQPTRDYVALRTLFHELSGRRVAGALRLKTDGVAVIFGDDDSSCLVLWTWHDEPVDTEINLELGPNLTAIDLWGRPVRLKIADGQVRLRLTPMPLVIRGVNAPLALLQGSFRLEPMYVEIHDVQSRPVLRFRNAYDDPISGTLTLKPPADWEVAPRSVRFKLGPGERFAQTLELTVPPRQVAARHDLAVHVVLNPPIATELDLATPLVIGLRDIALEATASWVGQDLLVEQVLRNLSGATVSFSAFCQAPARIRAEQAFLNVAPGEVAVRRYRFVDARELAGQTLHLGVQEIRGRRALDQLVKVPP